MAYPSNGVSILSPSASEVIMQAGIRKRPKYIVISTGEIDVPTFRMTRYAKPEHIEPIRVIITPKAKCGYCSSLSEKSSSRRLGTRS